MEITPLIKLLYFVEIGYYFHATMVLFWDNKMKDTTELVIHHVATVSLMVLSYLFGFFRIGCVVMILHDFSDPFMEYTKIILYSGYDSVANVGFALFTAAFFWTRLYLFPRYVISSVWYQARVECPYCAGWWTFNIFLFILQILHVFWGFLILKILVSTLKAGAPADSREDDDD